MKKFALSAAILMISPLAQVPAASAAPPPTPPPSTPQIFTLPTGDHVAMTKTGPRFLPAPGHDDMAFISSVNGQYTVVPASELAHLSSLDAYRIGTAEPRPPQAESRMSLLRINAITHGGKKAPASQVIVVNTDNPAAASLSTIMINGDARFQVPNGHYSVAVAAFNVEDADHRPETEFLTQNDVTVSDGGATVSLDGRRAHQVSFQTPLPSEYDAATIAWNRSSASKKGASIHMGAKAGTRFYVSDAPQAKTGTLRFSVTARQVSPESAATPYSYLIGIPAIDHIPADQAYRIDAATLSTVDSTVATDLPSQHIRLYDDWDIPQPSLTNPVMSGVPGIVTRAPYTTRQYLSVAPGMHYVGVMQPNDDPRGSLERFLVPRAGEHRTLTWRSGLTVPSPSTYDGPCFLCREGDVLHGYGMMDTDADGSVTQLTDGLTTITQDGTQIYQDSTMGVEFEQALASGKHRYQYTMDTSHAKPHTNLSTHSRISYGFDSSTGSAPVPLLYARTSVNANVHNSIAPGEATLSLTARHQAGVPDSPLKKAAIAISYDGKTWIPTATSIQDATHAKGTWTVPSDIKPGYLAVRIEAEDAQGSTLDEEVEHAALVNAPDGLDFTPSEPPTSTPTMKPVCADAPDGYAQCHAVKAVRPGGAVRKDGLPDGLARPDLVSAYKLPLTGGAGRTVAVVVAFDDPSAEADLAEYRKTYGLPPCTTENGCFKKVNGAGKPTPLPRYDYGWTSEIALDIEMVSAICPDCKILLVEADDNSAEALVAAERTATTSGAVAVSNSWGGTENSTAPHTSSAFSHPGVAVTASSGNDGFRRAQWPASLSEVIAVGGTTLSKDTNARGWTESAWKKGSSGCSGYSRKPAWQHDTHCRMRTASDIAAVGDPATGVAVYVEGEWWVFGGTSVAAPIIASMIALAGNSAAMTNARHIYSHSSALFDVTTGSNANWDCGGDYLCNARKGYDAPTGMGTPNGLGAL